ncbi:MAG: hypothetical protein EBR19_06970, partial [Chitinophagaceae bacterium]|nr:hypothetical protein [Chitinophagaceae bacterium]
SRGNSQYLDLNRDFIKCDSKEALSFTSIFRECDPDVFIDNHAFVPETHMLKPYDQRVMATLALMENFIAFTGNNAKEIQQLRNKTKQAAAAADQFPIKWKLDKTGFTEYSFKGFESGNKPSEVSSLSRLYYDRSKPFTKTIKVFDKFVPELSIVKPKVNMKCITSTVM